MVIAGILLLILSAWIGYQQKGREFQRRTGPAYATYREDLMARLAEGGLRWIAVVVAVLGATLLVTALEPTLGLLALLPYFGFLLGLSLCTSSAPPLRSGGASCPCRSTVARQVNATRRTLGQRSHT